MKRWVRVMVAVAVAVIFYSLISAQVRPVTWPRINDPVALRHEAQTLCRGEGGWRELPPALYPPAMTRLHPGSISVSGERVYIGLVPVPGGARFHGYYIWPSNADRPNGGIEREETGTPQAFSR